MIVYTDCMYISYNFSSLRQKKKRSKIDTLQQGLMRGRLKLDCRVSDYGSGINPWEYGSTSDFENCCRVVDL